MRRFFIELTIFVGVIAVLFVGWYAYLNYRENQHEPFIRALVPKIELVKTTCGEPRVIMLGGSNIAFGVNSQALSDSLGMRVINCGMHAGLGLQLSMRAISDYLREGDVVLVMPEYGLFYGDIYYGGQTISQLALMCPQFLADMSLKTLEISLKGIKYEFRHLPDTLDAKVVSKGEHFRYSCDGFDANGDEVSHLQCYFKHKVRPNLINDSIFNEEAVKDFVRILDEWKGRGVKSYVFWPCAYEKTYEINAEQIDYMSDFLQNTTYPIYGELAPSLFTDDEMFDTEYHLNDEGRNRNTQRVWDLCRRLGIGVK